MQTCSDHEQDEWHVIDYSLTISYHALSSSLALCTIRFKGLLQNYVISVLVDLGSTHDFVQ